MKTFFSTLFVVTMLLMVSGTNLFAGVNGKITGTVKDKKTGGPMELANVVLVGTQYGASTNQQGVYNILNVPAGIYDIKFAYLGYRPVTVKNIRVVPDITTTIDMQLTELEIDIDEIVVQAEKPLFEKGSTNSVRIVESEDLKNTPIRGIENIAALQAGVVKSDNSGGLTGNAILNIRGGRGGETLVIVDGVVVNDVSANVNSAAQAGSGTISQNAVDQLSIQVGGFEAKYGQAMSGIINTITKSGQDYYAVGGELATSEFTDNFGYNLYSLNFGGPVIGLKDMTFFTSYERLYAKDTSPRQNMTEARKDMTGASNRYTAKLDYKVTPSLRLTSSFNGSNRMDRGYIHAYSKNNTEHNVRYIQNEWSLNQKISYTISSSTYINADVYYRYNDYQRGDGVWFDQLEAYGDTSIAYQFINPETGDYLSQGGDYGVDEFLIFDKKHQVGAGYSRSNTTYYGTNINMTSQFDNHLVEVGGDLKIYTFRRFAMGVNGVSRNKNIQSLSERFYSTRSTAYGYDENGKESDKGNNYSTFNPFFPIIASAYIQDKIELKDLVFNFGLRYDYFSPDGKMVKDPNRPINIGIAETKVGAEDLEDQPEFGYISPRLGISFPFSDNAKFHAQFGRFVGFPAFLDLYLFEPALRYLEVDATTTINNGRAKPENTIQYEAGIDYGFGNVAALNVTAFYKEIRDLLNLNIYSSPNGQYYSISNIDFSTVKGISASLNTRRFASYFNFQLNYLYQVAEGTGSATNGNFLSAFRSGVIPRQVNPLDFNQAHTVTAVFDFRTGKDDGPQFMGFAPFANVGLNLVNTLNSGRPYTPKEAWNTTTGDTAPLSKTEGPVNSANGPTTFRMDLRVDKTFQTDLSITKLNSTIYLEVINVLNTRNIVNVYSATGEPDNDGWANTATGQSTIKSTLANDSAAQAQYVQDLKDYQNNPGNFGAARQVRLGLRFDF